MIHQYKSNGYNIVLDVESGAVHVVDDITYDVISLYEENSADEIISKLNTIEITEEKKLDFFTNECKKRFSYEFESNYKIKLIFSTVEITNQ